MAKIGRNDPCPCGSGKKYKHCCGKSESNILPFPGTEPEDFSGHQGDRHLTYMEQQGTPNKATELIHMMEGQLQDKNFNSREELDAYMQQLVQGYQSTGLDDFLGLSPEQMHAVLNLGPLAMEGLLSLNDAVTEADVRTIPVLRTALDLMRYLHDNDGTKATARGNLSRSCVQSIWDEQTASLHEDDEMRARFRPTGELKWFELYLVRRALRAAKLIKLYKGRFSLGDKGRSIFEKRSLNELYRHLFFTIGWMEDWNEGRADYQAFLPFCQQSFLFNLYLLGKCAAEWVTATTLADRFLKAFPQLYNDYMDPDNQDEFIEKFFRVHIGSSLVHYPRKLGLLDIKPGNYANKKYVAEQYRVSALYKKLLDWTIK